VSTPPTPVTLSSKLSNILEIINFALQALALIPGLGGPIALEQAIQRILMNALAAYQAETGKPFDITNIPLETPVK
jgi:hypothetical protein